MWTATQLPEETQRISTAASGVLARTCQFGNLALIQMMNGQAVKENHGPLALEGLAI